MPARVDIDFAVLEAEINAALGRACDALLSDPANVERFQEMFDRTGESGFYGPEAPVKGRGEQPAWQPNPAYMRSLEEIWAGSGGVSSERLLADNGLALERSLYDLFFESREYEDTDHVHRRVFSGQLLEQAGGRPLTFFMLTVPHSHERFELTTPPIIAISRSLA